MWFFLASQPETVKRERKIEVWGWGGAEIGKT